jgi:hypothetical protein
MYSTQNKMTKKNKTNKIQSKQRKNLKNLGKKKPLLLDDFY